MFIIFGVKSVKKPVKGGLVLSRFCPRCRRIVEMREFRSKRYFTLYFLPVFPLGRKGETVLVCPICDAAFLPH